MPQKRAVFLDRDGTLIQIIHRPDFVKKLTAPFHLSELKFYFETRMALELLHDFGFLRIMITNQPDVAHGYMDEETWQEIHQRVITKLKLDDYFMCRHRAQDRCPFKKPSPLMLQAAADKWGIDLAQSFMVGDTDQDMQAGRAAGCRVILLRRFYNEGVAADYVVDDLLQAVSIIRANSTRIDA